MIRYIKERYQAALDSVALDRRENSLRERHCQVMEQQFSVDEALSKIQLRVAESASNTFVDPDRTSAQLYNPTYYQTADALSYQDWRDIVMNCVMMYRKELLVRGWIEMHVNFIVGRNCRLIADDQDPNTQEYLAEFMKRNRWATRSRSFVRRLLRDGTGMWRLHTNRLDGRVDLRFLNPLLLVPPKTIPADEDVADYDFGVQTDPDDVEKVVAYWYDRLNNGNPKRIDADEVISCKLGDEEYKVGFPLLATGIKDVSELRDLYAARIILHINRTRIQRNVEYTGTKAEIQAAQAALRDARSTDANPLNRSLRPGTDHITNPNVKVTYANPSLEAGDADNDFRRYQNRFGVGFGGLPEYMVSADAANANYSSTMIAESPAVKVFEGYQVLIEESFMETGEFVLKKAIEKKELPAESFELDKDTGEKIIVPRKTTVKVSLPMLIHREIVQEQIAYSGMLADGVCSRRTYQINMDLDPKEEDEQIEREQAEQLHDQAALFREVRNLGGNGAPTEDNEDELANQTSDLDEEEA